MASELEVQRLLVRLIGDATSLSSALDDSIDDVDDFANVVDKKTTEAVASFKEMGDKIGGTLQSVGKGIGIAGAALTAGITAPLVLFGRNAVQASSDLKESINAVTVVFEEGAASLLKFGETADVAMGLSQRAFNELSTTTGSLLINLGGLSGTEAAQEMEKLATRASDMASVFNTDVSQALNAIGSALRGETEAIRKFSVSLDESTIKAKALELGLIKEAKEMTRVHKTTAALAIIYDQTSKLAGDFANTSDDLANRIRIQNAEFENMSGGIGDVLIPIKQRLVSITGELVSRFESLSDENKDLAIKIGLVASAIGPVLVGFGTFIFLSGTMVKSIVAIRVAFLAMGIQATASWAAATLGASLVVTGLLALGAALFEAQRRFGAFDPLIEAVKEAWQEIKTELTPVIQELGASFKSDLLPAMTDIIKSLAEVVKAVTPLVPLIAKGLVFSFKVLAFTLENIVLPKLKRVADFLGFIANAVREVATAVGLLDGGKFDPNSGSKIASAFAFMQGGGVFKDDLTGGVGAGKPVVDEKTKRIDDFFNSAEARKITEDADKFFEKLKSERIRKRLKERADEKRVLEREAQEEERRLQRLFEAGARLDEQFDPTKRFDRIKAELSQLKDLNFIGENTFERAMKGANKELKESLTALKEIDTILRGFEHTAVLAGSAADISQIKEQIRRFAALTDSSGGVGNGGSRPGVPFSSTQGPVEHFGFGGGSPGDNDRIIDELINIRNNTANTIQIPQANLGGN